MAKRIKSRTIKHIKRLRSEGWSLPEIHNKIKIGYGSIFRYIKNVEILPQYKDLWYSKRSGSRRRKFLAEKLAQTKAIKTIPSLSEKDGIIVIACLYWAEGNKKDFSFTNTDPEMIKVFVEMLERLNIPREKLRVTIRIYDDLDKGNCIKYWAETIGIPTRQIVNVNIIKGKKVGKLAYGMCRIRIIKGGDMLKYMTALRNRIANILRTGPNSSTDRTGVS